MPSGKYQSDSMRWLIYSISGFILCTFMLNMMSCQHDPVIGPDSGQPQDTTKIDDTTTVVPPGDTSVTNTVTCDTNKVYFATQILPILVSNCAIPTCHDRITKEDGVIMDSYQNIISTGEIKPNRWTDSELYEVLTVTSGKKAMPPAPRDRLTPQQIALIKKWVDQGATNDSCTTVNTTGCNTKNIMYQAHVNPILKTYCTGCHSGNGASGGINLATHTGVKAAAESGKLYSSIAWSGGAAKMPQNQAQLPACYINQIKAWIDGGRLNN